MVEGCSQICKIFYLIVHNLGCRFAVKNQASHSIHSYLCVGKEDLVTLTEVVLSIFARIVSYKAVFRALAVA